MAGVWRFQGEEARLKADLDSWRFGDATAAPTTPKKTLGLEGQLEAAETELLQGGRSERRYDLQLSKSEEQLRWFLLPQEACSQLQAQCAQAS